MKQINILAKLSVKTAVGERFSAVGGSGGALDLSVGLNFLHQRLELSYLMTGGMARGCSGS